MAQQMEQHHPTGLTEGQIPLLVEDDRVQTKHAGCKPLSLVISLIPLQRVDQIDSGAEANPLAVARDAAHADGGC